MFRRQYTIYLLVFILALIAINYRSQKMKADVEAEGELISPRGKILGRCQLIRRPDESLALRIHLKEALSGEPKVLVSTKPGLFLILGKMEGTAFILTLPESFKAREIKKIRLTNQEGLILAEARMAPAVLALEKSKE
ncbi:hypothetical protein [Thermosulfuriphilus sp.]